MRKPLPESRICSACGIQFKPTTPQFRCKECINALARKRNKERTQELIERGQYIRHEDMIPEEMKGTPNEREKNYRSLQRRILLMSREEYRDYLKNKLDDIVNNLPLWRYLTREGLGETPPKDVVKKPKLSKRDKWIQRGDTRNLSWDEWERMGFGLDEDK